MVSFEFATASRIIFRPGACQDSGCLAAELGNQPLVVIGVDPMRAAPLLNRLIDAQLSPAVFQVDGEPTLRRIQAAVERIRRDDCDLVIGFGGGSAIDTAKAAAALANNPGDLLDYLEGIGKGLPLSHPSLPVIAIPTTAGTGSEVTRNAVIGLPDQKVKVSLRSPGMLPRLALVDPELTHSLPPQVTAATGLDALTQLIEPFVCNRANPLTDALCREGLSRAAVALPKAYRDGQDSAAREAMALASLFGGLALANARLGAVHGFAAVLGGMYPAAHGALCARLLPFVCEMNVRVLRESSPDHPALERYRQIAALLTGHSDAEVEHGLEWLHALIVEMQIPALQSFGLQPSDFAEVIPRAQQASSMQGNPVKLDNRDLEEILVRASSG